MTGVTVKAPGPQGWGTTVANAETGEEIKGITSLRISIEPDSLIIVEADIMTAGIEVSGTIRYYTTDPSTGEAKQPSRIEFEDGSVWTAA